MPTLLADAYGARVRAGVIERDAAQEAAVRRLDFLRDQLVDFRLARKQSALGWLFARKRDGLDLRGLYIWGFVGRGKTMLMDLFFDHAPVARKRRVHFHTFMQDVHGAIHAWRQRRKRGEEKGDDPIPPVADALADTAWLLCFDEFSVTDIADAMVLGRLFQQLFARGVIVVATSNVEPSELYKDGLNRALFLPFIAMIEAHMDVVRLDARTDFRLEKLQGSSVYRAPADEDARAALDRAFTLVSGAAAGRPATLHVLGRDVPVPSAAGGVARFSFADLCEQPRGAADFLAIARQYHTLVLDGVPVMRAEDRNIVKRFIILIDALYDAHVKLIVSAAAEPPDLYRAEDGREAFEFDRTASRLIEMRSRDYLALPHGDAHSHGSGATHGLVDT